MKQIRDVDNNRGSLLAILISLTLLTVLIVPLTNTTFKAELVDDLFKPPVEPLNNQPSAIIIPDSNPFYAIITTPLAIRYDDKKEQHVIPLLIKNQHNPSKAVERAEKQVILDNNSILIINDSLSVKETSLHLAKTFWNRSNKVLLIKEDNLGYSLGVVASPIASYLSIPIIVTDEIDQYVMETLEDLEVNHIYICGNLSIRTVNVTYLNNVEEIIDECIGIIDDIFNTSVNYITMTNPSDTITPRVLDSVKQSFAGKLSSSVVLPTQAFNALIRRNTIAYHNFTIPSSYKYVQVKIDLENLNPEHVDLLGDRLYLILIGPDGNRYTYMSTGGGIPIRDENGRIKRDVLHYELTIYNQSGVYQVMILGQWFANKEGKYNLTITLDSLSNSIVPLMRNLSSLAPYLTAYHKGVVFAKPGFAFAADDHILYNGSICRGITQPGTNPLLIEPSNQHTIDIHHQLNNLLAKIADIDSNNTLALKQHYTTNPVYIAIMADPTMIPMYFYKNPDGLPDAPAHIMGFAVPSDFIYGDIDPKPDDPENNTYSYWPFQENIVGRVTGYDIQDCSALIARTIFYDRIIDDMDTWRDNALVQSGCGLEFQNIPVVTRLSHVIYGGRGEPTKFPTGESKFINMRLKKDLEEGDYKVNITQWTESQREGFNDTGLESIKNAGLLNRLLFPKKIIEYISSEDVVTGGEKQVNSNFIFVFSHGFYNLYEFGDILMDCRGFPFVTMLARIHPSLGSRLSTKGSFDVRSVENMEYGPSVIFVVSCITGRTDGIKPENTLSQTYLHAGVNTYIGATRVTADPGYLDPRPLPNGVGFGILGYLNATLRYKIKGEYPELHFGGLIAEEFILNLNKNQTTGLALRNAKNVFLPKDANSTFLWSPPLPFSSCNPTLDKQILSSINQNSQFSQRTKVLDKKYVALHEFVLYGDPAFNPYQPKNKG
ncbi:MAG: C25 family cysteine peptidase [Candidatus Thermoplasmatota archaeon]